MDGLGDVGLEVRYFGARLVLKLLVSDLDEAVALEVIAVLTASSDILTSRH
jgi:hypothetical protein